MTRTFSCYVDSRDSEKQAVAERLIETALNGDEMCLISVQTLTEFVDVALNKIKLPYEIVGQYLEVFLSCRQSRRIRISLSGVLRLNSDIRFNSMTQ